MLFNYKVRRINIHIYICICVYICINIYVYIYVYEVYVLLVGYEGNKGIRLCSVSHVYNPGGLVSYCRRKSKVWIGRKCVYVCVGVGGVLITDV